MKKMMSILIAVLWMLLLTCSSTASAYPTEIKYGTPIIDGQLDDMYRKSASTSIDTQGTYTWGGTSQNDAYVITYYLWDDQYLYVCCKAYDTDLLDVGEARYQAYPATWTAECVEVFLTQEMADGRFIWMPLDMPFISVTIVTERQIPSMGLPIKSITPNRLNIRQRFHF